MPTDYFKSKGTFTNIDIPSLEGSDTNELTPNVAWSTEKIVKLLDDYNHGLVDITKIHNSPFLNNDPNQRKPGIAFSYTNEEMCELKKCTSDIVYFGDKYCKLFTDEGYVNVKLRDYQQGILRGMSKHNRTLLLASRQIGKCVSFNETIWVNGEKLRIGEMQNKISNINILEKIRRFLYRIYELLK